MNPELKLTPEQQRIYDRVPADKPRSRLEPYRALILRWRRQGRSYRRIQQILADECQIEVSHKAVLKFVKRKVRPREVEPEPEAQTALLLPPSTNESGQAVETDSPKPRRTPEEIAAMREAARSRNHQPVVQEKREERPLFHYDPSKPPINKNYF